MQLIFLCQLTIPIQTHSLHLLYYKSITYLSISYNSNLINSCLPFHTKFPAANSSKMALAKDRNPNDSSHMSGLAHQSYVLYGNAIKEYEEGESPGKNGNLGGSSSNSSLSSPSSVTNSGGFVYRAATTNFHQQQPEEGHSVINFKPGTCNYENGFMQGGGSSCFLSFDENDEQTYSSLSPIQLMNSGSGSIDNLMENLNCIQSGRSVKENHHHEELESFGWPNPPVSDNTQHLATQELCFHKRAHSGENEQAFKKQCTSSIATKKAKQKSSQSKDPQSIAAKKRRERISERLKVLQDLVPNGSKVDLVTMLEKAISYVKFLQLQVKVLATDEFWPVQGGKPPELSQVKEAIDAILSSSQKDRNSSSK